MAAGRMEVNLGGCVSNYCYRSDNQTMTNPKDNKLHLSFRSQEKDNIFLRVRVYVELLKKVRYLKYNDIIHK